MNHDDSLYKAARRKIVLWCLAAIVVVSLSFYIPMYFIAVRQLENIRSQLIAEFPNSAHTFELRKEVRKANHDDIRREVAVALIANQGIVLVAGAVGSFFFVRRILRPIRKAHAAQAEFAANANHQIRTPITVIKAELESAALHNDYSPETTKAVYASIAEEADKLQLITEHLLAQASQVSGDTSKDDNITARQISQLAKRLASAHGVELTDVIPDAVCLPLSHHELYMLLDILLDNSKKYAGVPNIHSKLTVQKTHGKVVLNYEDNGNGIEPKVLSRILKRGERGTHDHDTSGSGLGLSILAQTVAGHGGTVKITSLSKGSRFFISLPIPKR
jgi:signal transduction histidine kinase